MNNPRRLLLFALLLDWLGQFILLYLIYLIFPCIGDSCFSNFSREHQYLFAVAFLLYPLLGWLFGSYTVLRWQRLTLPVLLQRLSITAVVTLLALSIASSFTNTLASVSILLPTFQFIWIFFLTIWSLLVRLALRKGLFLSDSSRVLIFASSQELPTVFDAWRRVPHRQSLCPVNSSELAYLLDRASDQIFVAISPLVRLDPSYRTLLSRLEMTDSRQVYVFTVLSLFEQYQERLPPALMSDTHISYEDLPWTSTFSVQAQIKRTADLFLSVFLLLITLPFLLFCALLIWLEDRGPVLYSQQRSGWMGRPFIVYKLRTMKVQPVDAPVLWTQPGDKRITVVGDFLRRVRLDELPQLFNVLNGDMSLIGPRPERPELEDELESRIPHYRKRHWMRPGLSGWAQVCAPYASSVDDSDLKLSYDIYYLRNFSIWLDLLILFRTIKTVLKAGGR